MIDNNYQFKPGDEVELRVRLLEHHPSRGWAVTIIGRPEERAAIFAADQLRLGTLTESPLAVADRVKLKDSPTSLARGSIVAIKDDDAFIDWGNTNNPRWSARLRLSDLERAP